MIILETLNTAENVLKILFVWCDKRKKELGLTDISRLTQINKSTVYKILLSLRKRNMVCLDPVTKKYRIDYGVLKLSSQFLKQCDLCTLAHPFMEKLAAKSKKTITLALKKRNYLVFIDRVDGCEDVRFYCDIGKIVYYNNGAAAKAVFANLTEAQKLEITSEPVYKFTPKTLSWENLLQQSEQIKKKGYSISDEEVDIGIFAVGAPIFNAQDEVVAGIAMATLKAVLNEDRIKEMEIQTMETAKLISQKIGYSGI